MCVKLCQLKNEMIVNGKTKVCQGCQRKVGHQMETPSYLPESLRGLAIIVPEITETMHVCPLTEVNEAIFAYYVCTSIILLVN